MSISAFVANNRATSQRYYQRHKAAGLCVRCPARATRGRFCSRHAKVKAAIVARRRAQRNEAGLCWCGRPLVDNARCPYHACLLTIARAKRRVPTAGRSLACTACGVRGHNKLTCAWLPSDVVDDLEDIVRARLAEVA